MPDDIVTRLRMQDADYALQEEAADEIEQLRAVNARLESFLHPVGQIEQVNGFRTGVSPKGVRRD